MDQFEAIRDLHDRATRGETLSVEEQSLLDAWYAQQDASESAQIAGAVSGPVSRQTIQEQIDATIERLQAVTGQIQGVLEENERLRREIDSLTIRLAHTSSSRAA
jgi:uncharacterized coiled-coil DUF342 family protein